LVSRGEDSDYRAAERDGNAVADTGVMTGFTGAVRVVGAVTGFTAGAPGPTSRYPLTVGL
jgi:hypothetical protein